MATSDWQSGDYCTIGEPPKAKHPARRERGIEMTRDQLDRLRSQYGREKGGRHATGTCGYMGSLCTDCYARELALFRQFAADKPALPHENPQAYWLRIDGPFGDAWYEAALRELDRQSEKGVSK